MTSDHPKKEDLTCPFHDDLCHSVKKNSERLFWVLILTAINMLFNGGLGVLKLLEHWAK